MKTWLRRCAVSALAMALWAGAGHAAGKTIFMATWRGCEEACTGFRDYLTGKGLDVDVVTRDAATDKAALPAMVEDARALHPDLIVTWGTSVTQAFADEIGADGYAEDGMSAMHLIQELAAGLDPAPGESLSKVA